MLESIMQVIQSNIIEIIGAILVGIASFIGTKIKILYEQKVTDDTKRKVVRTVVEAVEQMLNEKGITITEFEMKMLIESVVNGFNSGIKKEGEK